ncbi:hypothetical protein NQ176_g10640 [Zarea fungicola]|uniref:Uncharacterized protein n=1 Tax=Zarea fungicola TaxID=93591 RepID=A0ACC1MGC2_9HYPO|nr:hypothetical protein NQ176_g10640 [Lecanicillium fungicola]
MKFFTSTFALLTGTSALVIERDLPTAISVIGDVSKAFSSLAKATEDYNGDFAPIEQAANIVLAKLDSGTANLNGMSALTLGECPSLVVPSGELAKQSDDLSKLMQSRVQDVQAAKKCASVRAFIDKGMAGAATLVTALANKVPSTLQSTVESQGDKATLPFRDARAAYAEDKCKDI